MARKKGTRLQAIPLKLVHATAAQQKAAWNVIFPWLQTLAQQVPWPMTYQAEQELQKPERQQQMMAKLDEALDAALNAGDGS